MPQVLQVLQHRASSNQKLFMEIVYEGLIGVLAPHLHLLCMMRPKQPNCAV
jgi:hypothetical protein